MSGASFSMDTSAFGKLLKGGLEAMQDTQGLMEAVGEAMVSSTIERFEKQKGPDGTSWEPTQRGGNILVDKGELKGSMVYEASIDKVIWGSDKVYAAIHQLGGPAGRNKSFEMTARPYIGVDEEDKAEIAEMMRLHAAKGFGLE